MPLRMCGSVSARFSVWFSARSRAANAVDVGVEHLEPAHVERGERRRSAHDVKRCAALRARFGQRERAVREIEHASVMRPGGFCSLASQRKRPATIRWITRKRSSSNAMTMRLPSRRTSTTRCFSTADERRVDRAQHERIDDPHAHQRLAGARGRSAHRNRRRRREAQASRRRHGADVGRAPTGLGDVLRSLARRDARSLRSSERNEDPHDPESIRHCRARSSRRRCSRERSSQPLRNPRRDGAERRNQLPERRHRPGRGRPDARDQRGVSRRADVHAAQRHEGTDEFVADVDVRVRDSTGQTVVAAAGRDRSSCCGCRTARMRSRRSATATQDLPLDIVAGKHIGFVAGRGESGYRPRFAAMRRRKALSLMNPAASFWS